MIICRDIITYLAIDIKLYNNTIVRGRGIYQGYMETMLKFNNYDFETLNGKLHPSPKESFINA